MFSQFCAKNEALSCRSAQFARAIVMSLTPGEVERFYAIWFPLLYEVNQQLRLVPVFPRNRGDAPVSPEQALPLRSALWENVSLLDRFVAENPAGLSASDLAIAASWKHRVAGRFYVFRHLKKHSIFLSADRAAQGYGVHTLVSPFAELLGERVPQVAHTVLLPFEGKIIYDSLITPASFTWGGPWVDLEARYRDLRERGELMTDLLGAPTADEPKRVSSVNRKVLTAFKKALGEYRLSASMVAEHTETLTDFATSFLARKLPPSTLLEISRRDITTYHAIREGQVNLISFKRFVWFLRDSGRIERDNAQRLLNFLKHR